MRPKALGDTQFTQSENHVSFQFTRPCKKLSPMLAGVYTALLAEGSWKDAETLWSMGEAWKGSVKQTPGDKHSLPNQGKKPEQIFFCLSQAEE